MQENKALPKQKLRKSKKVVKSEHETKKICATHPRNSGEQLSLKKSNRLQPKTEKNGLLTMKKTIQSAARGGIDQPSQL
jgi:hypothetical protein